jgi:hypothetical protein
VSIGCPFEKKVPAFAKPLGTILRIVYLFCTVRTFRCGRNPAKGPVDVGKNETILIPLVSYFGRGVARHCLSFHVGSAASPAPARSRTTEFLRNEGPVMGDQHGNSANQFRRP